jgi:CheY-like chemotaxis protein
MPGMTGLELLDRVLREGLAPEVVLVTSDELALQRAAAQGLRVLDKSCGPEQLRALVASVATPP